MTRVARSAIASGCMYRCWSCHSSFCYSNTGLIKRMMGLRLNTGYSQTVWLDDPGR
jgi:hypothetical protein